MRKLENSNPSFRLRGRRGAFYWDVSNNLVQASKTLECACMLRVFCLGTYWINHCIILVRNRYWYFYCLFNGNLNQKLFPFPSRKYFAMYFAFSLFIFCRKQKTPKYHFDLHNKLSFKALRNELYCEFLKVFSRKFPVEM